MDWELQQRLRSTLLLAGLTVFLLVILAFPKTAVVRNLRRMLLYVSWPVHAVLPSAVPVEPPADASVEEDPARSLDRSDRASEGLRAPGWQVLADENARLRAALSLKTRRWPQAVAAAVIGRDPQRWFQELVVDRGSDDGVSQDDPVVAVVDGEPALVGRIVDVEPTLSRVMLLQDSLSAIPAMVMSRDGEDGVVEGGEERQAILKYLDRRSQVQIGDTVVTSGLGRRFPPGIPIGIVEDLALDERELFLQARLRPRIQGQRLRVVLVLTDPEPRREQDQP